MEKRFRRRRAAVAAIALGVILLGVLAGFGIPQVVRYITHPPAVIQGADAAAGALSGGDTVTVSGQNLTSVTGVAFGSEDVPTFTIVDDSTLTVVAPHAADYEPGSVVDIEFDAGPDGFAIDSPLTWQYDVVTAVDQQLAYAFAHWDTYNTAEYGDFNEWGGDCMNFVSQTLVARGWATTDDWYNDAQVDWAAAFVYAPAFDEWLVEHTEVGAVRLELEQRDQAKIGDIVMFDWNNDGDPNHIQVISGIEVVKGETRLLVVGHNLDSTYRDVDVALAGEEPGATAWIWSLPA